jgi:hypothetical protein
LPANISVKAFETSILSHGVDIQMLASASSDGEVKTWTITKDGKITENGSYDTGNRILCLALYDAAIEQLDTFKRSLPKPDESELSSEESDEDDSIEAAEWKGIEDA